MILRKMCAHEQIDLEKCVKPHCILKKKWYTILEFRIHMEVLHESKCFERPDGVEE